MHRSPASLAAELSIDPSLTMFNPFLPLAVKALCIGAVLWSIRVMVNQVATAVSAKRAGIDVPIAGIIGSVTLAGVALVLLSLSVR